MVIPKIATLILLEKQGKHLKFLDKNLLLSLLHKLKSGSFFFFWEKLPLHSGKQDAFPFSRLYLSRHNSNCSCKPRFPEGTETKGTLSNSKPTLHCVLKSLSYPLFQKPAVLSFDIPAYCS